MSDGIQAARSWRQWVIQGLQRCSSHLSCKLDMASPCSGPAQGTLYGAPSTHPHTSEVKPMCHPRSIITTNPRGSWKGTHSLDPQA